MKVKATQMATDPVSGFTDAITDTADQISQGIHDPTGEAIYDPAAWMGEVATAEANGAPLELESPAPRPKKPRAKKATVT